jgi:hypothetical protein
VARSGLVVAEEGPAGCKSAKRREGRVREMKRGRERETGRTDLPPPPADLRHRVPRTVPPRATPLSTADPAPPCAARRHRAPRSLAA